MNKLLAIVAPMALALLGLGALAVWMFAGPWRGADRLPGLNRLAVWRNRGPVALLHLRQPGLDGRPATGAGGAGSAPLRGTLTPGPGKASTISGQWPGFRGAHRDGICDDPGIRLARHWPDKGPGLLWSVELGEGYAGAAVAGGCVYVLDYDRQQSADCLRCLSLDDGKEIWAYRYPNEVKRNHGMSRTVPAVIDKYVVSLGPKCHVLCLDPADGRRRWMLDLVRQYGARVPEWYAGQCPLVETDWPSGPRAILAPGGPALLAAVDCRTGAALWKSPNPQDWRMTHASIVPTKLAGRRMYVYCGKGGVAGVAADDGTILWQTSDWKISIATCPSPVILPEGKVFLCGGYNSGSLMLQVKEDSGRFAVKSLFRLSPSQFGSTQHTPIFYQGRLFGVREKDKQLVCLDPDGKEVWSSGSQRRFGGGPYLIAGGLIYVLDERGILTLAEAGLSGYKELARAQVLDGDDCWGPMALVHGRLIVRDFTRMACLDVAAKEGAP
jgi:outer membrane protein assembly factor BamB